MCPIDIRHYKNIDLNRFISRRLYDEALHAFAREQYDYAIEIVFRAINESDENNNTQTIEVYDGLVLVGKCSRWMNDYHQLDVVCNLLQESARWCIDDFNHIILTAHRSSNDAKDFSEIEPDVSAIDCLIEHDFVAREKLLYRGLGRLRLGKYRDAMTDLEVGYLFSSLAMDYRLQAEYANCLGLYYMGVGNIRHAIEWFNKSYLTVKITKSDRRVGLATLNLGVCMYKMGNYEKAERYISTSISHLEIGRDELNLQRSYIAFANVLRLTRKFSAAKEVIDKVYMLVCDKRFRREECLSLELLGDILKDTEYYSDALLSYRRGRIIADEIAPEGDLVGGFLRREGECLIFQGACGEGLELLAKALFHVRKIGDRYEEGVIARCLAQGFLIANETSRALEYIENAILLLNDVDARHEYALSHIVAAEINLRCIDTTHDREQSDSLDKAWNHTIVAQGIILVHGIDYWIDTVKRLQSRIVKRRQEEHRYRASIGLLESPENGLQNRAKSPQQVIIAESKAMKEVMQAAVAYAPYDDSILLTGETGTGKEMIAQLIHQHSNRKSGRMVTINIAAIAPTIFERELFGHAKGSFSGAVTDCRGIVSTANGGTLFIDEIGELALDLQVKLLRLLQDGSYHRLGDPSVKYADLRIIAATNIDLEAAVETGQFRRDLYYRFASLEIYIPSLHERPEDILPLLEHYLSVYEEKPVTVNHYFNEVSIRLLERYRWPGNIREIMQVARRASLSKIRRGRVDIVLGKKGKQVSISGPDPCMSIVANCCDNARSLSRAHLLLALEECGGNRTAAARMLGISRSSIYRRIAKLDTER